MADRIEMIREMLKANPDDNFLQHALALECIKLGDDAAARKLFESILANDPDYIGSYYHLAKLLERTGETKLAAWWYEKGMERAAALNESKTLSELRSAYEELIF